MRLGNYIKAWLIICVRIDVSGRKDGDNSGWNETSGCMRRLNGCGDHVHVGYIKWVHICR